MLKKNLRATHAGPVPKSPCGCGKSSTARTTLAVTRPSCMECVEKHLGAAWVLLAEYRDGYPFRLRAIGHLHEAEDESQEWPRLHQAIREARKAYQRHGEVVDFQKLTEIIEEHHARG